MCNGFYKMGKLTVEQLKEFFRYAADHADRIDIHHIPEGSMSRQNYDGATLDEMIEMSSTEHHNVCINRKVYDNPNDFGRDGEIGFCTMGGKSLYLSIFVPVKIVDELVEKYQLEKLG